MDERKEQLKEKIFNAFKDNKFPGNWNIVNSNTAEPFEIKEAFKGKDDWTKLEADFPDNVPNGLSSALSFFSEAAFRFYLPAYLIAHIDDKLPEIDVVFHLCSHFTNSGKDGPISNSKVYGEATWWDYGTYRCSLFTLQEIQAIIDYLYYNLDREDYDGKTNLMKSDIREALENYWLKRLEYLKNRSKVLNQ